jgi:phenylacetate-CoA ligase
MNWVFKYSLLLNKFPIDRALIEFLKIQDANNNKSRAFNIFHHHLENNKFYSDFFKNQQLKGIKKWEEIPIIKKKDFQIELSTIIGKVKSDKIHIHNTSGSSGTPFYFAKDKFCHAMTWAYSDYRLREHGIHLGKTIQARFYGIPLSKFKYRKERLKDFLAGRVRYPVFDLSDENLDKILNDFRKKKFVYINGYTSSLVVFAKFIIRQNLSLKAICPSLKICMPTSEVCDDLDRQTLERGFGVRVINEYGAAELDLIALEDTEGDWVINEETLFVEILDDAGFPVDPGIEGRVVVTALYNKAMPFIRYELGDKAILSDKTKNGRRILEKVSGRINDLIYLPSGKVSPGLTFYYISKKLLEEGGKIKEFIIKQKKLNYFVIEYSSDFEIGIDEKQKCEKAMDLYLEPNLKLEFQKVQRIERGRSGKLKHFFSELDSITA